MKILSIISVIFGYLININTVREPIIGQVRNDLGQELYKVNIEIKDSKESTITDCNGIFQIEANLGDTMVISKEGYNTEIGVLKTHFNNLIVLRFNYTKFRKEIENDPKLDGLCNQANGQPLFILDGKSSESPYFKSNIDVLTEDDLLPMIVLKGLKATNRFGHCARNGAIWMTTNCYFSKSQ